MDDEATESDLENKAPEMVTADLKQSLVDVMHKLDSNGMTIAAAMVSLAIDSVEKSNLPSGSPNSSSVH